MKNDYLALWGVSQGTAYKDHRYTYIYIYIYIYIFFFFQNKSKFYDQTI